MAAHQLGGDGQPEAEAALARAALERREQVVARLGGQAGAGVADTDPPGRIRVARAQFDRSRRAGRLDRLARVAHEVRQHPMQLLAVRPHGQARRHIGDERDARRLAARRQPLALDHVLDQRTQRDMGQRGRRLFGLAKGQRAFAQVHRPADRADQLWRGARHGGILAVFHPVGEKLRRGQDVAQVMADLGHRATELRQPFLLPQRVGQLLLQRLQRDLGLAQFGHRGGWLDHPPRILGRLGIGRHVVHHPLDRHHQQAAHRHEQQERRHHRDDRRQREDTQTVVDHRLPHRRGFGRHLDQQPGILHRVADHPDDPVAGVEQFRHRIADQQERVGIAQVIGGIDRFRDRRRQHQLPHRIPSQHHVQHPGIGQQFLFQAVGDHAVVGQQRQRGDLRAFEPQQQVILAEPGDRRHENQHFGQHDEERGQDQEAAGEGIEKHACAFARIQGRKRRTVRTTRLPSGLSNNFREK